MSAFRDSWMEHSPMSGVAVLVAVLCAGCDGDVLSEAPDAAHGDAEPTQEETIQLGVVSEFDPVPVADDGSERPLVLLDGVEVCALGTKHCTLTDAEGIYVLEDLDPTTPRAGVRLSKPGYLTTLLATHLEPGFNELSGGMPTDALAMGFAQLAGIPWPDPDTGVLALNISGPGGISPSRATVSVSPAPLYGPVYTTAEGVPDPVLTETTSSPLVLAAGLSPDDHQVDVARGGIQCIRGDAGWASTTSTATVPVEAGAVTVLSATCI